MNLGDDNKDESQDDLFTKLHSISKEDWVDMGYLGKKIRARSARIFSRVGLWRSLEAFFLH